VRLALDTNRYIDLVAERSEVVTVVGMASEIFLPFVVVGELRYAFRNGSLQASNESRFRRFLSTNPVKTLWPDEQTLDLYVTLRLQLSKMGTPIPENDLWIAAFTLQHGLTLYSRDSHFDRLPHLPRV